jgi:hypothetical protein
MVAQVKQRLNARRQYGLADRAKQLGWTTVEIIEDAGFQDCARAVAWCRFLMISGIWPGSTPPVPAHTAFRSSPWPKWQPDFPASAPLIGERHFIERYD